jgi:hypothetical protein
LRVLVAYCYKTGNTKAISDDIEEPLRTRHEVDVLRVEMVREYSGHLRAPKCGTKMPQGDLALGSAMQFPGPG